VRLGSTATNDPLANYASAIRVFRSFQRDYPSNSLAARAEGRVGDCYLQLAGADPAAFQNASNAYQRVVDSPFADASTRSLAEIGLASTLEAQAGQRRGEDTSPLLQSALNHYLNVFYQKNLRQGEEPDPFMIKRAGLEGGRLAEALQLTIQARNIYLRLLEDLPTLRPLLEIKILNMQSSDELQVE
jgi:hypothetical protein